MTTTESNSDLGQTIVDALRHYERKNGTSAFGRQPLYAGPAVVKSEPRTYEKHKPDSFFVDLIRAQSGNQESAQRLQRHQREMVVEKRADPNWTLGEGGEFTPPIWAVDQFASIARAGRVVADLVPNLRLGKGQTVNVPTFTAGSDTGLQSAQGGAGTEVDQTTSSQASPVATIEGHVDVSQQVLDQTPSPGYDGIAYLDLQRAANADLEYQLINGTGANGQLTGLLNVTGRISDTAYTDASPTVPEMLVPVGKAYAVMSWTRMLPPEVLLMHPRRWAWMGSSADTATRPFVNLGEDDKTAIATLVAETTGIDVGVAGATADEAIWYRPSDALLYESADHYLVMPNPLSGTLETRLSLHRYVAFVNRYPTSIAVVSGTGFSQPTGY